MSQRESNAEIRLLQPIGAEVDGVDLCRPVSEKMQRTLRDAWLADYGILLFRGQELNEEQQFHIAAIFGDVDRRPAFRGSGMSHVSNVVEGSYNPQGELGFHQDNNFAPRPLPTLMLYGVEVPPKGAGGETLISDGRLSYRLLPSELQARIDGLHVRHRERRPDMPGRKPLLRSGPDVLQADRPLAFRHPRSGTISLMLSPRHVDCIIGLSRAESDALIEELTAYIGLPETTYRHTWQRGDLLIWDNISFHHARTDFDPKHRRHLRRMAID